MTTIDFYFNAPDRLQVACRLAAKAVAREARLLVYTDDAALAQRVDRLLWTTPPTGFVPHCAAHDPIAAETPVVLTTDTAETAGCDVLLNLSDGCPPHFEAFARLLEVVSRDEADRTQARTRYRFYRDRGYRITEHNLDTERARGG